MGVGAGEGELLDCLELSPLLIKKRSNPDLRLPVCNVGNLGFLGEGPKGVSTETGVIEVEDERTGVVGDSDRARLRGSDVIAGASGLEPKNDSIPR